MKSALKIFFLVLYLILLFFVNSSRSNDAHEIQNPIINFILTKILPDGSHEQYPLQIAHGESVHAVVQPHCSILELSFHDCKELEDSISAKLYHQGVYTPTCPSCGLREYTSNRKEIIQLIAQKFQYTSYLEIGTNDDLVFNEARLLFQRSVGVDPNKGGTHRMTSDEFFEQNIEPFDLIFIDGLHEANQVIRDVQNALKWLNPNGTIVMHDCNPSLEQYGGPQPVDGYVNWNGDVWKAAIAYRLKSDIEIVIVDVDTGVGVIRRRPNEHPLSDYWREFLGVNPLSMLKFSDFAKHKSDLFRLISIGELENWLDDA